MSTGGLAFNFVYLGYQAFESWIKYKSVFPWSHSNFKNVNNSGFRWVLIPAFSIDTILVALASFSSIFAL